MNDSPTLLFLHGVSRTEPTDEWRTALEDALRTIRSHDLSRVQVIAPKYRHGLEGVDRTKPVPKVRVRSLRGEDLVRHQREFHRRRTAMEALLGNDDEGGRLPGGKAIAAKVAELKRFEQAQNYVADQAVRAHVLRDVLGEVRGVKRLLIIGHSLGSVIAADLLRRLSPDVEVVGLITIGSPLAHEKLQTVELSKELADPPANLGWWVNFWSTADGVPTRHGVSSLIPWVLDHRIDAPFRSIKNAHSAVTYLGHKRVAAAVSRGLFGKEQSAATSASEGPDVALDVPALFALLGLRFAHLAAKGLEDETLERYGEGLRQVQADTYERLAAQAGAEARVMPRMLQDLAVDLSDPGARPSEPGIPPAFEVHDAIVPLVSIATSNTLHPFEIDISKDKRLKAMEQLTLELGFGKKVGRDVIAAVDEARDALKGPTNWWKWTAIGIGTAAVAVASGGLILAAAPGLAGAAAITSALAAFGPGGMVGGLLTAGTLVTAGGGGIAIGLAAPTTSAATVEAVLMNQLATAILRRKQNLAQDPQTFTSLNALATSLDREFAKLAAVSDEGAPSLKDIQRKREAVARAIGYLEENGLGSRA